MVCKEIAVLQMSQKGIFNGNVNMGWSILVCCIKFAKQACKGDVTWE